jgi:CheY-like chemotaxis protein
MPNKRILVVDDEPDMLEVIGMRVSNWGYDLLKARDGKEGIAAVKSGQADIVILDYMLPDMDGLVVLKEIRKINKDIPVVMFTAYPNPKVMQGADKLGISAYVPKLSAFADTGELLKSAVDISVKQIEGRKQ